MCDLVMLGQSRWPGTCLLSGTLLDKDENQSLCHNHWPTLNGIQEMFAFYAYFNCFLGEVLVFLRNNLNTEGN